MADALRGTGNTYDPAALENILDRTKGYSAPALLNVCNTARDGPLEHALEQPQGTPLRPIRNDEFEAACRTVASDYNKDLVEKLKKYAADRPTTLSGASSDSD